MVVHPRHAQLINRFTAFEITGDERTYPLVENRLAVPLSLNFARWARQEPIYFRRLFDRPVAEELLRPYMVTREEYNYLWPVAQEYSGRTAVRMST